MYCGFDFGTSNTVVTLVSETGQPVFTYTDPTLIFMPEKEDGRQHLYIGEKAREEYIRHGMQGRFIQAVKSLLPDDGFTFTRIFGRPYKAEDLVAMVIRHFHAILSRHSETEIHTAVFGRPVKFSDKTRQDDLAEERIRTAALKSGFREVLFLPEPIGAALRYARGVKKACTIFVGDFGGGTSDFTVLRITPNDTGPPATEVLATHGIRVGGTDFNSAIMWNCLTPYFGRDSEYESWGRMLPVPVHIFRAICRWDRIAFLKTSEFREELRYIQNGAADPRAIRRLAHLIDDDLGFGLFQAIEDAKIRLSTEKETALNFSHDPLEVAINVSRNDFKIFIADRIEAVSLAVDEVMRMAAVDPHEITSVFLTGGSSMVPSIQKVFWKVFGREKVQCDDEMFASVSHGLALHALEKKLKN